MNFLLVSNQMGQPNFQPQGFPMPVMPGHVAPFAGNNPPFP